MVELKAPSVCRSLSLMVLPAGSRCCHSNPVLGASCAKDCLCNGQRGACTLYLFSETWGTGLNSKASKARMKPLSVGFPF